MTTLATIFGFLISAFITCEGAEVLKQVTISMIGGKSISMFQSLLVLPGLLIENELRGAFQIVDFKHQIFILFNLVCKITIV